MRLWGGRFWMGRANGLHLLSGACLVFHEMSNLSAEKALTWKSCVFQAYFSPAICFVVDLECVWMPILAQIRGITGSICAAKLGKETVIILGFPSVAFASKRLKFAVHFKRMHFPYFKSSELHSRISCNYVAS